MKFRGSLTVGCLLLLQACGDDGPASGGSSGTAQGGTGGAASSTGGAASTTGGQGPGGESTGGSSAGGGGSAPCVPLGPETCATPEDDDCDGTECSLWSRIDGGPAGSDGASDVSVSPSGEVYFLAGGVGPFAFGSTSISNGWGVAKLSATGQGLWLREMPSSTQDANTRRLVHTSAGPVVCFGFEGTINLGGEDLVAGGGDDVAIASFDADGVHRWSLSLKSSSFMSLSTLASTPSGNVLFSGFTGGVVTSGGTTVIDTPGPILVMVDPVDGSILWARTMVEWSAGAPNPAYLTVDKDGQIYLAGDYNGTPDYGQGPLPDSNESAFILRLSPTGTPLESERLCEGSCSVGALVAGIDGELYVSGFTMGFTTLAGEELSGTNTYLARLDGLTQATWLKRYLYVGTSGLGGPVEIAVQADGTVTFAHPFHGSVDFGLGLLTSEGELNVGVGKLSPEGVGLWHRGFGGPNAFARSPSIAVQPTGEVTVALSLRQGSIDLGSGQLDAIGGVGDMVLARLAP